MQATLLDNCRSLLTELELISSNDTVIAQPLTGGVASDIAMVQIADRKLCIKFALPKLNVRVDWFAPVHRNLAEYAWLDLVAKVAPVNAIKLMGQSKRLHGFAMEYLEGEGIYLWKRALLAEEPEQEEAARVGELIGQVHAASTNAAFDATPFANRDDFKAIRIEPYLLYTAQTHKDIAPTLQKIATQLYTSNQVLCHGDVSPKNIFLRNGHPVILDAECATMGDASFDPAFCLNHLILKAIHLPLSQERYLANAMQLWQAYQTHVTWEAVENLDARVCRLLPALMLARVDGKSPVEYLSVAKQNIVRSIALRLIKTPVPHLDELLHSVAQQLLSASKC